MHNLKISPNEFLEKLKGKKVQVVLKWKSKFTGKLKTYDEFMNLRLYDLEEIPFNIEESVVQGISQGIASEKIEEITIRCNNVLYVRSLEDSAFL